MSRIIYLPNAQKCGRIKGIFNFMPKNTINYNDVIKKYPWIIKKNQNCILSPDSDGLLCGLFMSYYLDWHIRGFYDGKILLIEKKFHPQDCVFIDMEIFRNTIKSVGQHMVMYNKNELPDNWDNFKNCVSANNLRNYDVTHDFQKKYPFGTIHLLLGIVGQEVKIAIPKSAICPLLYTDGTFKNLFNYPDNCLSWLSFLKAGESNALKNIFFNDHYSISTLMVALKDFFDELRTIGGGKRGGDKIKISDSSGNHVNLSETGKLKPEILAQAETLLKLLQNKTSWAYNVKNWHWNNFQVYKFQKGSIKPGKARYNDLLKNSPISLAVISALSIEYTLDRGKVF